MKKHAKIDDFSVKFEQKLKHEKIDTPNGNFIKQHTKIDVFLSKFERKFNHTKMDTPKVIALHNTPNL